MILRQYLSCLGTPRTEAEGSEAPKDWSPENTISPNKPLMRRGAVAARSGDTKYCPRPLVISAAGQGEATRRCLVKSWASENPAKAVKCLDGDVSATGFWWCLHCHRISEPIDAGDPYPQCVHCSSRRLEWRAPVKSGEVIAVAKALPQLPDPPAPKPRQRLHRLPAAERDLRVLVRTGYWFCQGCQEVTQRRKRDGAGCVEGSCVLCGANQVVWQEPVFDAEAVKELA